MPVEPGRRSKEMCQALSRVLHGRAGEQVERPDGPSHTHVMPNYLWVAPTKGAAGKKGRTGALQPLRVLWEDGPVHVVAASASREVAWRAKGLGLNLSGSCLLHSGSGEEAREWDMHTVVHNVPCADPKQTYGQVQRLIEDGGSAWWEAMMMLDQWVQQHAERVNQAVAAEVSDGNDSSGVLDAEQLAAVATRVVFGEDGRPSRLGRVLDRCTSLEVDLPVDPVRFLSTEIHRTLSEAVHDEIGDPHVGPKIRRLARRMGLGVSLEDLLSEYRRLYPSDRLGTKRAVQALTTAPRIEARLDTLPLDESRVAA